MRVAALALDYDGTLAKDGLVDAATVDALQRAREAGLCLLMVTGRELTSLFATFDRVDLFDRVVAENGAVLYEPASQAIEVLGAPPPPALIAALTGAGVPIAVGHSIVATVTPHEHAALAALRSLGLEWHVIFNKHAVMLLPADITKATGLRAALPALGLRPDDVVAVGDAENDQAFMRYCGLAVAVANALPAVKEGADLVTRAARGAGVTELIDLVLAGALDVMEPDRRKHARSESEVA